MAPFTEFHPRHGQSHCQFSALPTLHLQLLANDGPCFPCNSDASRQFSSRPIFPLLAQQPKTKACLICIDGWGISPKEDATGDAIRNAQHPVMAGFAKTYPDSVTEVEAHGLFVGLPEGLMGNSEVGHLNIGAGRIVYQVCFEEGALFDGLGGVIKSIDVAASVPGGYVTATQDIVRIDLSIKEKKLGKIPTLVDAFEKAKGGNKRIHFAGLVRTTTFGQTAILSWETE